MDNFFYKTWHSFFLLTFILLLFMGCSRKPVKYTIAVSQCSEDIWRDKLNEDYSLHLRQCGIAFFHSP